MPVATAKRALGSALHCGDQCGYWQTGGRTTLCMVDGLGHGVDAEEAAGAALEYVADHLGEPLPHIFAGCDAAIRKTRGAAMGIAVVEEDACTLTFAGIGNTYLIIVGAQPARLASRPGIVGAGCREVITQTMPLSPHDVAIMCTDGVREQLTVSGYPRADLQRLADKILAEWGRETDDAAVMVFRRNGEDG